VPLLLRHPPFFLIILFFSTTLSTGMTGISLHMQWPLSSQSDVSILKVNNRFVITDQNPRQLWKSSFVSFAILGFKIKSWKVKLCD
jgi:hypothetical protein